MIRFEEAVKRDGPFEKVGARPGWSGSTSSAKALTRENDRLMSGENLFFKFLGVTQSAKCQAVIRGHLSQVVFIGLSCCLLAEFAADSNALADSFK